MSDHILQARIVEVENKQMKKDCNESVVQVTVFNFQTLNFLVGLLYGIRADLCSIMQQFIN